MHRFPFLLLLITTLLLPLLAYPNAAQPGLWNAGGTGSFSLLYPDDPTANQHIQMAKEQVSIQLYKGFAVVKGHYWMYNHSQDTLRIRTGYPLNASFYGGSGQQNMAEVYFDALYKLQVQINGQAQTLIDTPLSGTASINQNWYVWHNTFLPQDTTEIEVLFLVNTNSAHIRQGYTIDRINGFVYLLETGATWKQPILQGQVRIQLLDGLTPQDLRGIAPDSIFTYSPSTQTFRYDFTQLSPTSQNNIVITYHTLIEPFDFAAITAQSDTYFNTLTQFANTPLTQTDWQPLTTGDPYQSHAINWFGVWMTVLFIVVPILILLTVILTVVFAIRKMNRRKASLKQQ